MKHLVALTFAAALTVAAAGPSTLPVEATPAEADPGWQAFINGQSADALQHYRTEAERGQRVAQYNLAVMLLQGLGTRARPAE